MPRPYRAGERQAASQPTRARIVEAAVKLLGEPDQVGEFTVDAVAKRAGISRMTVYYQFGSRAALLEAVLDDLADRGGMPEIATAMRQQNTEEALKTLVKVFCHFWASQRLAVRRLRALAVLDPELTGVFRDLRRRQMLDALVERATSAAPIDSRRAEDAVDVLHTLTSFATYDSMAHDAADDEARVAALLQDLTVRILRDAVTPAQTVAHHTRT